MDPLTSKQGEIERRAAEVAVSYPALWTKMIAEWRQPGSQDRAWLMYSANYLFRAGNARWALDPLRLKHRLPLAPEMPAGDLKDLDFVLLLYAYGDHLDPHLLAQLVDFSTFWVIPVPVLESLGAKVEIPADRLIVPEPMRTFQIQGIRITPFDGLHWEKQTGTDSLRGVPAMGYLFEFHDKRWLFPGDTRNYEAGKLPSFGPVDSLFAHLWLGRCSALLESPPLLDEFCRFCTDLKPKQIVLTHLEEFGHRAGEYWDRTFARTVSAWFQNNGVQVHLDSACLGDSVLL